MKDLEKTLIGLPIYYGSEYIASSDLWRIGAILGDIQRHLSVGSTGHYDGLRPRILRSEQVESMAGVRTRMNCNLVICSLHLRTA